MVEHHASSGADRDTGHQVLDVQLCVTGDLVQDLGSLLVVIIPSLPLSLLSTYTNTLSICK
jgi:hypothetical protein